MLLHARRRFENLLQRVTAEVTGMQNRPELNGKNAQIVGFDTAKARYCASLRGLPTRPRKSDCEHPLFVLLRTTTIAGIMRTSPVSAEPRCSSATSSCPPARA